MTHWTTQSECRKHDPELWFPIGNNPRTRRQVKQAKAICHSCPVMNTCAEDAIARGESDGVRGGLDFRGGVRKMP